MGTLTYTTNPIQDAYLFAYDAVGRMGAYFRLSAGKVKRGVANFFNAIDDYCRTMEYDIRLQEDAEEYFRRRNDDTYDKMRPVFLDNSTEAEGGLVPKLVSEPVETGVIA